MKNIRLKAINPIISLVLAISLFSTISCSKVEVSGEIKKTSNNFEQIDVLLEEDLAIHKEKSLERIKRAVGRYEVKEYLFGSRHPFGTDEPEREMRGKYLVIKDDLTVYFDNVEYKYNKIKNLKYSEVSNNEDCPFPRILDLGENFIYLSFVDALDETKHAEFGIYLQIYIPDRIFSSKEDAYIWGGEWFRQNGLYRLEKIE